MIASTHLAVGAAAGLTVQKLLSSDASNPEKLFWAFAVGFVSHVVLDALPHQEYSLESASLLWVLLAEMGFVFALVLSSRNSLLLNLIILFGMIGGALPDVIDLAYDYIFNWPWLYGLGRTIHTLHFKGQSYSGFVFNFYVQVILAILASLFVRFKLTH